MALAQLAKHFVNEADSMRAFFEKFPNAKEVGSPVESMFKVFLVEGWDVPEGDNDIIDIVFELGRQGVRVGWEFREK